MKTAVVLQARMSSKRLPGKALRLVKGVPLLGYCLNRLLRVRLASGLIVATSTDKSDDPVADFCKTRGVPCFRGDLINVAKRYEDLLRQRPCDGFVRVCGDSPFMDPALVDQAIGLFRSGSWDLVTNAQERSYPKGQGLEVFSTASFHQAFPELKLPEHQEHIGKYFLENNGRFKILNFKCQEGNYADRNLSIDTAEDFDRFERFIGAMKKNFEDYTWQEVLQGYFKT